jgi:hypothetical protein
VDSVTSFWGQPKATQRKLLEESCNSLFAIKQVRRLNGLYTCLDIAFGSTGQILDDLAE